MVALNNIEAYDDDDDDDVAGFEGRWQNKGNESGNVTLAIKKMAVYASKIFVNIGAMANWCIK